jgi:hypothetical protein
MKEETDSLEDRSAFLRFAAASPGCPQEGTVEPVAGGTETVLVVEDEAAILNIGKIMLEQLGYTVLTAEIPGVFAPG